MGRLGRHKKTTDFLAGDLGIEGLIFLTVLLFVLFLYELNPLFFEF